MTTVKVIGAGLAGSEAAWQLAERGISVQLYEMRPKVMSPAHKTGNFAELVCGYLQVVDGFLPFRCRPIDGCLQIRFVFQSYPPALAHEHDRAIEPLNEIRCYALLAVQLSSILRFLPHALLNLVDYLLRLRDVGALLLDFVA
jgi:hypothetical protein